MTRSRETAPGDASRPDPYDVVFYQPWISPLYAASDEAPVGGAERQVHFVARALAEAGLNVAVVADPLAGMRERVDGVDVIRRPARTGSSFLARLRRTLALARLLLGTETEALVKRVAGYDTAFIALIAKLRRRRFIYSSANVVDFELTRLESRVKCALFEWGVRRADLIVVQTEEQEELCVRRFGRRPVVIKSIAEPAQRRSQPPRAFLWVGRLVAYKNPLAFVELARSLPKARFEMVAVLPGDYDRGLYEAIRNADEELENLTLIPPQGRAGTERLLDSAIAVVNTAEFEGMPNVFLEAWARGVPALALSHDPGGVIEREGLGGFARGSAARLTELARRMSEPGAVESYAGRCRDYVAREHSPSAVGSQWLRALDWGASGPSAS